MILGKGEQIAQQGDLWAGLFTTGTIPEDYLPRGMDNLGQMAFITRGTTKFLSMLHTRFNKSKTVNTREHKVHEISELDRVFRVADVTGESFANDPELGKTVIYFDTDIGAQIQPNDVLFFPEIFSCYYNDPNGTKTGLYYSRTFGLDTVENVELYFTECEQCLVTNVTEVSGSLKNYAKVTLKRGDYGRGSKDMQGLVIPPSDIRYGTHGIIKKNDKAIRGLPSFPEGSDAPRGFWKNPVIDVNYTQEFKYALEITKESEIEKTWIGKTPIEIYRLLKTRQATLDIERHFLNGRKGKKIDPLGRVQYTMGGVIESIPKDKEHVHIWEANKELNYKNLLDFISKIPEAGGSTKRDLYCGIDLYVALKKSFYDKNFLRYNPEDSKRFDIPIETLVGAGIEINVIPLYTLQEIGWGMRGLVLDFSVPSYVPVTHAGWDMKVERDIGPVGVQIYKEQWIGMKGLERRYTQYQHIVDFSLASI